MPMPSNEARHNLLSNERLDSFWDALGLELWPFLYLTVESRRIACRCLQTKRGAICYRMSVSTPSGTACGSSYGRFCILCAPPHVPLPMCPAVIFFDFDNFDHFSDFIDFSFFHFFSFFRICSTRKRMVPALQRETQR